MKTPTVKFERILIALLALGLMILGGCDNFMTSTEDFKAKLKEEVAVANAESVSLTVQTEDDSMGTTSPLGATTVKVGVPFDIAVAVDGDYSFLYWEQVGGAGEVVFASASTRQTTATLTSAANGVVIQAVCNARPTVVSILPFNNESDVLISLPIKITFSEPVTVNENTMSFISIQRRQLGDPLAPVSINYFFDPPVLNGSELMIPLNPSYKLGDASKNYEIFVSISKYITDLDGIGMSANYPTSRFVTSTVGDTVKPYIGPITVKNSGLVDLSPGNYIKSNSFILDYIATDAGSSYLNTTILDGVTVIKDNVLHSRDLPVTIDAIEGSHTLTVSVKDNTGNEETADPVTVFLDTTRPNTPTFVSSNSPYPDGGSFYCRTGGVTFTLASTDPGSGSGIKGYTTDPAGISPAPVVNPVLTTSSTVYAVDNAGNVSASGLSLTVIQDNTPPSVPTIDSSTSPYENVGTY